MLMLKGEAEVCREAGDSGEDGQGQELRPEAAGLLGLQRTLCTHPRYLQSAHSILSFCFSHLRLYHMHFPSATQYLYLSFLIKDFIYVFLERGEEREKERKRNTDVREKQWSAASLMATTRDLAHHPSTCPPWGSNQWRAACGTVAQPTEPHQSGPYLSFKLSF